MIALQEELDWECYRLYGLLDERSRLCRTTTRPTSSLGERAFEIVMARRMAAGEARNDMVRAARLDADHRNSRRIGRADYRKLVERRIEVIEHDPNIALIEQPEYKRRWNTEPWDEQLKRALRGWLLDRLEDRRRTGPSWR